MQVSPPPLQNSLQVSAEPLLSEHDGIQRGPHTPSTQVPASRSLPSYHNGHSLPQLPQLSLSVDEDELPGYLEAAREILAA
jgi:hypothetical protein